MWEFAAAMLGLLSVVGLGWVTADGRRHARLSRDAALLAQLPRGRARRELKALIEEDVVAWAAARRAGPTIGYFWFLALGCFGLAWIIDIATAALPRDEPWTTDATLLLNVLLFGATFLGASLVLAVVVGGAIRTWGWIARRRSVARALHWLARRHASVRTRLSSDPSPASSRQG